MNIDEATRRDIDARLEKFGCKECGRIRVMLGWVGNDYRRAQHRPRRGPETATGEERRQAARAALAEKYAIASDHLEEHVSKTNKHARDKASNWRDREWCKKCGKHRTQNADGVCRHCGPNARKMRKCTECGLPTQSTTSLCVEHRPTGQGQRGPCTNCGALTSRTERICARCKDFGVTSSAPAADEDPCAECGIEPKSKDKDHCRGCEEALKDDNNVRGLQESHYDIEHHGEWRLDPVRRIQVWVPLPDLAAQRDEVTIKRQANAMAGQFTDLPELDSEAALECALDGCANRFIPTRKSHRFCGDTCKDRANYLRRKDRAA